MTNVFVKNNNYKTAPAKDKFILKFIEWDYSLRNKFILFTQALLFGNRDVEIVEKI